MSTSYRNGMFVKITRSGPRRYVQLVEACRDEAGRPRQKTIITLGRLDQMDGQLDALIQGLLRATGRDPTEGSEPTFDSAHALGDTSALTLLWRELKLDSLARIFRRKHRQVPVEKLLRVMVFNRLCEPSSKLGVLRWLETALVPGVATGSVSHDRLLAAMDALMDEIEAVEARLSELIRPLLDPELTVVFYDFTTVSVTTEAELGEKASSILHRWSIGCRSRFAPMRRSVLSRWCCIGFCVKGCRPTIPVSRRPGAWKPSAVSNIIRFVFQSKP